MNELTKGSAKPTMRMPPSFDLLEPDLAKLQEVREAAAIAQGSTWELVARIDEAIAVAERQSHTLAAATEPATIKTAGAYLLLLTRAYPVGTQNGEMFGELLLDDVLSLQPTIGAVEAACRRWRRTKKYLPAISEMLEEVKAADAHLRGTAEFVERLQVVRERFAKQLD